MTTTKLRWLIPAAIILLGGGCATGKGLRPFSSDGCSLFPDGALNAPGLWCDCCFTHDISYWQGGTSADRLLADQALRQCVLERTADSALATMMYDGVRLGGHPAFPTWYRWGYGWPYGRGYAPLQAAEERQVQEKLDAYLARHPRGYCGK